ADKPRCPTCPRSLIPFEEKGPSGRIAPIAKNRWSGSPSISRPLRSPVETHPMEHPQVFSKYASILLDVAVEKALDYGVPDSLDVKRGMQVQVPLRGRLRNGYVIELKEES